MLTPPTPLPPIAVVLSSGAKRGLAHIGVLEVLHPLLKELCAEQKVFFVTCSAGSIAAGFYLDKLDPQQAKAAALELAAHPRYRLFGMPYLLSGIQGNGFFSTANLQRFLAERISAKDLSELKAPLHAVTANLINGKQETLSSGDPGKTLAASAAIPGIFQAVEINGALYVDGYVFTEMPVILARHLGAKFIIAVDVHDNILLGGDSSQVTNSLMRSVSIINLQRIRLDRTQADVIIDLNFIEEGSLFLKKKEAEQLYERGKRTAIATLPQVAAKLEAFLYRGVINVPPPAA